jgi:hypothetical protein
VVADELSSIPDIQDKHRRVLAGELKITTFRALARADRRDIHRAMRNLRPRPTLEQIARWQDHARSGLSEAADQSDWHPAASFAVVFAQRQPRDGEWEHRIEVERTEVEPEQERRTWPEWDCREICGWMRSQLGLSDVAPPEVQPAAQAGTGKRAVGGPAPRGAGARPARPGDAEPAAPPAATARGRGELRIGSVTVIDPGGQVGRMAAGAGGTPPVDIVTAGAGGAPPVDVAGAGGAPPADVAAAGAVAQGPPASPAGPLRVEITVAGARRGQEIQAVARVLPRGAPGWNPQDPVVIKGAGAASFDLSRLPEGRHEVALIAWAPDGSMAPVAVRLPEITIQPRQ